MRASTPASPSTAAIERGQQAAGAEPERGRRGPAVAHDVVGLGEVGGRVVERADAAAGLQAHAAGRPRGSRASMIAVAPSVALTGVLPVDVLMKSAPCAMASCGGAVDGVGSTSSPVSRITFSRGCRPARLRAHGVDHRRGRSGVAGERTPGRGARGRSRRRRRPAPARSSRPRRRSASSPVGKFTTVATRTSVPHSCSTAMRDVAGPHAHRGHVAVRAVRPGAQRGDVVDRWRASPSSVRSSSASARRADETGSCVHAHHPNHGG